MKAIFFVIYLLSILLPLNPVLADSPGSDTVSIPAEELAFLTEQLKQFERDIEARLGQIAELQAEVAHKDRKIQSLGELAQRLEQLTTDNETLTRENAGLQARIANLESSLTTRTDLAAENADLKGRNNSLNARIADLEAQIARIEAPDTGSGPAPEEDIGSAQEIATLGPVTEPPVPRDKPPVPQISRPTTPPAPSPPSPSRPAFQHVASSVTGYVFDNTGNKLPNQDTRIFRVNVDLTAAPISQREYRKFCEQSTAVRCPRGLGNSNAPVTGISWNDARAYMNWLSRHTGQTYRFPWYQELAAGRAAGLSTGVASEWSSKYDAGAQVVHLSGEIPDAILAPLDQGRADTGFRLAIEE